MVERSGDTGTDYRKVGKGWSSVFARLRRAYTSGTSTGNGNRLLYGFERAERNYFTGTEYLRAHRWLGPSP